MYFYIRSVFVLSCALRQADPRRGVLPTVYNLHNFRINSEWEEAREPDASR
jgi:hypothetical protein